MYTALAAINTRQKGNNVELYVIVCALKAGDAGLAVRR